MLLPLACFAGAPQPVWHSGQLKDAPFAPESSCAVTDKTLLLPERHAIKVDVSTLPEKLEALSISAWVRPEKFDRYNEIFRIESGEGRVLFSFQEKGAILALGLDVNGYYRECDAPINPEELLDGCWHFVAATFDGKMLCVYLDGMLVHQLQRRGSAKVASAPGFIGSHGGRGEFFQGGLDDLRLYTETLSPAMLSAIFKEGASKLTEKAMASVSDEWKPFLQMRSTFAETLLKSRRILQKSGRKLPPEVKYIFAMNLAAKFPEECAKFAQLFSQAPSRFVVLPDLKELETAMEKQVATLIEYMPLTEDQWKLCSKEECGKWRELKKWTDKMASRMKSNEGVFAEILLQAVSADWPDVPARPKVAEAVAPYVIPATPDPKNWTGVEMTAAIEADWMRQVGNKPDLKDELARTRALAARLGVSAIGLDEIEKAAAVSKLPDAKKKDLYLAVRRIKRNLMFGNPAIDFSEILLVDMPYPGGKEWRHETRHRLGYMAVPGGQLLVLKFGSSGVLKFGEVSARRLMPQAPLHGSFWRPDLSYDAKRVLFCFKPHNEKSFHIYEINLDGRGLRQLTSGIFDDYDPVYLPDGKHYVFSSSRGHTYVRCMPPTNAYNLMRGALNGDDLFFISANNEPDYLPAVMHDGRVIYTRWEYTDKPLWRAQSLWTVNPDGTQPNTFWGNQSVWPDLLKDARPIPGSRKVMFTGTAHHNWFDGSIGIVDPDGGLNFPHGLTKVTAERVWPESGNGPVDPIESKNYQSYGKYDGYQTPYPFSERDFMVSALRDGKFVLYLMDTDGNRELIYEGVNHIFHAIPVRSRKKPPVRPDLVKWPSEKDRMNPEGGVIYSGNVWHGAPKELQGKAKFLRIMHIEQKTYTYWNKRPALSTGPVVSLLQSDGVKRVLGTVPVHADGSVNFNAPSGVALHFQLLDENHRTLQTMRSFANVMPGESRGCLGCHEMHSRAPHQDYGNVKALRSKPDEITPVPWAYDDVFTVAPDGCKTIADAVRATPVSPNVGANNYSPKSNHTRRFGTSISYIKDVQPVLDRYCGKCHQGEGKARKKFDLTLRGYEPYKTIIGHPGWGRTHAEPDEHPPGYDLAGTLKVENYGTKDPAAYRTTEPMTRLSYKSKLVKLASSGKHHDVKVDPYSLLRLIIWVDAMCPYRCDEDIRKMEDPVFQGSDWLAIKPRLETAPILIRPGPFKAHDNVEWLED